MLTPPTEPALRTRCSRSLASISTAVCLDPKAGSSLRRERMENVLFARRLFGDDSTPAVVRQQLALGRDLETAAVGERRLGGGPDDSDPLPGGSMSALRVEAPLIEALPVPARAEPTFEAAQSLKMLGSARLLPIRTKLASLGAIRSMDRSQLQTLVELRERWGSVGACSGDDWLGWYRASRGRVGEWLS